ncbi:MAG TPA: serine/threonine-protein kinase [Pyrinomonadaceae bacterium]|nr:serine/threonine-protein kinase [Pyrinomonadaceae bacterium]
MGIQDLVGQVLDGKYSIQREIGRGGMGAVYYAVHMGTKRPVAVKVIVPQFMAHEEFVERFKREAEASGRLHHPNVVDVTDFGFAETGEGRVAYLVMEFLEGCTLGEILKEEKTLSLSWTVDILEQVCLAVAEAHKQGVIHRDLKPDNIWLEPNQRGGYTVKVLDFGIAKLENPTVEYTAEIPASAIPRLEEKIPTTYIVPLATDPTEVAPTDPNATGFETFIESRNTGIPKPQSSLTMAMAPAATDRRSPVTDEASFYERSTAEITRVGAIMGTPLYMSPEQCRGERPGFTSDVYSLGVIAYQMLSGKTPFAGEHFSVIANHLQTKPPRLRGRRIPRKVKRVIHAALEKEPLKRPDTAEIFSSQLRAHSEGIFGIIRRSLSIYTESFSKIIWFSLLLYFPTILLAGLTFVLSVLQFNGSFSNSVLAMAYTVTQSLIKHTNIAASTIAETLVGAAVAWTVVQYIDAPLRSYKVSRAIRAVAGKWKHFLWILPLRVLIGLFIQGDLPGLPIGLMFLFSFFDSLLFWMVPCVVMMESFGGLRIFRRSWQLTGRVIWTVLAATLLNQFIFMILGGSIVIILYNLTAFFSQQFLPSVAELPIDDFNRLIEGLGLFALKFVGAIVLPFFGVITALAYLKARHAGGESMERLFDTFRNAEVLQSNWQRRMRNVREI